MSEHKVENYVLVSVGGYGTEKYVMPLEAGLQIMQALKHAQAVVDVYETNRYMLYPKAAAAPKFDFSLLSVAEYAEINLREPK